VEILLKGFQCRRCGHQWKPRKEGVPAKCPSCDSPHWQRPRGEGLAAHLAEVFQLYEVPEDQRDKIIAYVQQYRGVAHALRKAVPELERVFGKTSRRLDIEVDPESGWEELFGVVLLKEYPENAFELLHNFDQWFLQAPAEVRMNRNFNVVTEDDYTAV
jgi:hypothetical protein